MQRATPEFWRYEAGSFCQSMNAYLNISSCFTFTLRLCSSARAACCFFLLLTSLHLIFFTAPESGTTLKLFNESYKIVCTKRNACAYLFYKEMAPLHKHCMCHLLLQARVGVLYVTSTINTKRCTRLAAHTTAML